MPITGNGAAQAGLGGPRGYGEIMVPRSDDGSLALDLSGIFEAGLNYFGVAYDATAIIVNTNGTLSFLSALPGYPTAQNRQIARDLIAPYWGDVDTRLDGEGAESGAVWVDLDAASDTVTVTWDNVGVYRRNADVGNTVQLQLVDRGGGDFDIVFRYQQIGWTLGSGIEDAGARTGLASTRMAAPDWQFAVDNAAGLAALPDTVGNTGVTGLWVYEMRNGALSGGSSGGGSGNGSGNGSGGGSGSGSGGGSGGEQRGTFAAEALSGGIGEDSLIGLGGNDTLRGVAGGDSLDGGTGNDLLDGGAGADTLYAGDGADTLIAGDGDDFLFGGDTEADLRDEAYGGTGNDSIDGGAGNDVLRGDAGNDTILGGTGVDEVLGGAGNDELSGQAWSDVILGGDGNDFINGGFGFDRLNGGAGSDRFYHSGDPGHGSDWIQDYAADQWDWLYYGPTADRSDFLIQRALTPNAGAPGVQEVFVTHRDSGVLLWALVDGAAQDRLHILAGGALFDLFL